MYTEAPKADAFAHKPIMLGQVVTALLPERGGIFVDCTLGGGGHSEAILDRLPEGSRLIGIDRDGDALAAAQERLQSYGNKFSALRGNFFDIKRILNREGLESVDGILADLGVSSWQLDNAKRGFSYMQDAPLDMRMDDRASLTARDVVNDYGQQELTRLLRDYGEERWASRIASFIVEKRKGQPIETTGQLVDIIKAAIPASARREGPHPAKRSFQAIRVEVNGELEGLGSALEDMVDCLGPFGRLAVITFHSLEDRIAKQTFAKLNKPCICSPKAPICTCGKTPVVKLVSRKPILPTESELEDNPRARSAKLRVVEKIAK